MLLMQYIVKGRVFFFRHVQLESERPASRGETDRQSTTRSPFQYFLTLCGGERGCCSILLLSCVVAKVVKYDEN